MSKLKSKARHNAYKGKFHPDVPRMLGELGALCTGLNTEAWFTEGDCTDTAIQAKRLCLACPARVECLDVSETEEFGVWAGLSRRDRKKYLRSMAPLAWLKAHDERTLSTYDKRFGWSIDRLMDHLRRPERGGAPDRVPYRRLRGHNGLRIVI